MDDSTLEDARRFLSHAEERLTHCRLLAKQALARVARAFSQPDAGAVRVVRSTGDRVVLVCAGIPCCFQFFASATEPRILIGNLRLTDCGVRFSPRVCWLFHNNILMTLEDDGFEVSNVAPWARVALADVLKAAPLMSPQETDAIVARIEDATPFIRD